MNLQSIKLVYIFVLAFVVIILPNFVLASETNGTIDSTDKYAWSENIGWLNFGCDNCNVSITDSVITGYAWNANYGWINLGPSGSGVSNNSEGVLSGQAWGENTGWIDFSGVTIDSSGYFNGYASGTITGQVSFNCANTSSCSSSDFKVRTDWRPASSRAAEESTGNTTTTGGGGLPPEAYNPPSAPVDGFDVIINNGVNVTNSRHVTLSFDAGPSVEKVAISNTGNFEDASQESYMPTMNWDLCSKFGGLVQLSSCPEGEYRVYVKFYTKYGRASQIVSDSIIYKKIEEPLSDSIPYKETYKHEHSAADTIFNRSLTLGDRGDDVKALQKWLNQISGFKLASNGPGSPGNETRYFGQLTASALTKFQQAHKEQIGLSSITGIFDQKTIKFINSFFVSKPLDVVVEPTSFVFKKNLRLGMINDDVKRLQQLFNSNPETQLASNGPGSPGNETRYFGQLTREVVKRFQKKYNIVSSGDEYTTGYGLVGPKTRAKLQDVFGGL